jgi:hypothetical protein
LADLEMTFADASFGREPLESYLFSEVHRNAFNHPAKSLIGNTSGAPVILVRHVRAALNEEVRCQPWRMR